MVLRRILLGAVLLWCVLIYATPILELEGGFGASIAGVSYHFFSHVCSQLDSHSFFLYGIKFPVCIRCTSIYTAFFLSVLFFPYLSRFTVTHFSSRWLLAIGIVPMLIDVVFTFTLIHSATTITRLFTGAWFGFISGIVLTPLLEEVVARTLSSIFKRTAIASTTKAKSIY